jgi:putative DNA primase/helicase
MVAGSFWGCHRDSARKEKGFAESWNTTGNKLEETAQAHCDSLLILDETHLAGDTEKKRAAAVLDAAFRLSEGTKKGRYNEKDGNSAWRLYFLSTSNLSLDELARQGQVPIDDQHRGRLVDIVLPLSSNSHGIYEDLHGFSDGAKLTDVIKTRCRSVFGTPGYRFVCEIYKDKNTRSAAKEFVADRRKKYIKIIKRKAKAQQLKPLERATARFATVYAAGCLAIKYKIFLWSRKDLLKAVLSCQMDTLIAFAGHSLDPVSKLQKQLVDYLSRNRAQFVNLDSSKPSLGEHKFGSVLGYTHTHNGVDWIYLTSDKLDELIGVGKQARRFKQKLVQQKLMASSSENRFVVQRPIFAAKGNKGYRWVHAFKACLATG